MREPTYFILAALLDGPRHGYGIAQTARGLSDGRVRLTAGTLYGALDRLSREGLVVAEREELVRGRPRRYYAITDEGRGAVVEEAEAKHAAAKLVLRLKARPA